MYNETLSKGFSLVITVEWEGAMCDPASHVSAVVGPNISLESVVAISSKKDPLRVWCVHVCMRVCRAPVCVHRQVYKLKTRRCMLPTMEKNIFITFSSGIFLINLEYYS